jgi:hypothetical protein
MAYIGFDLDNTLGIFHHVAAAGHFFSQDIFNNSETLQLNPNFYLSSSLRKRLAAAEERFLRQIAIRPHLVNEILRPNLDALIRPVLQGRIYGKVRAVCIYSNTINTFSMKLAKTLIEDRYKAPGLFCACVDATDPLREMDFHTEKGRTAEPKKTYPVLKAIFKTLCHVRSSIPPSKMIFIDDRKVPHSIKSAEADGLTYIKPVAYNPVISRDHKKEILYILLETLSAEELLNDNEYLNSSIFRCLKRPYFNEKIRVIGNFGDLLQYVADEIAAPWGTGSTHFKDDGKTLRQELIRGLGRH